MSILDTIDGLCAHDMSMGHRWHSCHKTDDDRSAAAATFALPWRYDDWILMHIKNYRVVQLVSFIDARVPLDHDDVAALPDRGCGPAGAHNLDWYE